MKQELSSLDLHYLIKELKGLVGAKIDKIYQPKKEELLFQMHLTGHGRKIIRMLPGNLVYITQHKTPSPQKPFGYCTFLRKYLSNARLVDVNQKEFERIVEMVFETKDKKFKFYIELFTKGNILLCDENEVILSPLENQVWKDRTIKKGEKYLYPKRGNDFLNLDHNELAKLLKDSDKESLVKAFAIDLGLGGVYAEELCLISGIEKNKKPSKISENEFDSLFSAVDKLRNMSLSPKIILEKDIVKDIVPFEIMFYKDFESKEFKTFNEALDEVFTTVLVVETQERKQKVEDKGIVKAEKVIQAQTKQVNKMKKDEEESRKKGELIFENYQTVEEILNEIKKAREKYSWKEIKEKLKGHKVIKDIKEKEGKIIVEL